MEVGEGVTSSLPIRALEQLGYTVLPKRALNLRLPTYDEILQHYARKDLTSALANMRTLKHYVVNGHKILDTRLSHTIRKEERHAVAEKLGNALNHLLETRNQFRGNNMFVVRMAMFNLRELAQKSDPGLSERISEIEQRMVAQLMIYNQLDDDQEKLVLKLNREGIDEEKKNKQLEENKQKLDKRRSKVVDEFEDRIKEFFDLFRSPENPAS